MRGLACPDYSVVKLNAAGRKGPEGSKLVKFGEQLAKLESLLPDHRFGLVGENVVMADESGTNFFSEQLRAQPVLVDAADRGPLLSGAKKVPGMMEAGQNRREQGARWMLRANRGGFRETGSTLHGNTQHTQWHRRMASCR